MNPSARFRMCLAAMCLIFIVPKPTHANVFEIDLIDPTKKPQIKVTVKDKDGVARELKAIVDTGNSDGILVNNNTATALGLTIGGEQKIRGAGGITTLKKTDFTGEKSLVVNGLTTPAGQAAASLTISGSGIAGASLPDDTLLIGQDFLSGFVQTFNPKASKLNLTALDQLDKKPAVLPKLKASPRRTDGKGGLNLFDDIAGLHWDTSMEVASQTGDFVIGTGWDMSLLSEDFAEQIALDLGSLPFVPFPTPIGDINIWQASLGYSLFPGDPTSLAAFGILPNSFNPDGINILGNDILSAQGTYQIDTDARLLRAGEIVPEPSTVLLALMGLAVFSARASLRKKKVSL